MKQASLSSFFNLPKRAPPAEISSASTKKLKMETKASKLPEVKDDDVENFHNFACKGKSLKSKSSSPQSNRSSSAEKNSPLCSLRSVVESPEKSEKVVVPSPDTLTEKVKADEKEKKGGEMDVHGRLKEAERSRIEEKAIDEELQDKEEEEDVPSGLSSYEQLREENMRRNAEFLSELGLDSLKPQTSLVRPTAKIPRKRARSPVQPMAPSRRSSRVANIPAATDYTVDNATEDMEEEKSEEEEEEEGDLDDSDVIRYIMSCKNSSGKDGKAVAGTGETSRKDACPSNINLFQDDPISCDDMTAIYSMCFHPDHTGMLLTAGKGGNVTFFRTPFDESSSSTSKSKKGGADENDSVIYSFQAHSRWVSTAKFVTPGLISKSSENSLPIISASDDTTIKLWDAGKSHTSKKNRKLPHLFWSSTKCHDRGVFALDICESLVLSGSKDKTVCVSQILSDGSPLTPVHRFSLHGGVVKSVDWKKDGCINLYASGGQDRRVCVKDIRARGDTADVEIEDCHDGGVHSVQWNPYGNSNLLMTAGMDPIIKVFDIRNAESPLYEFCGHSDSSVRKFKTIIPPTFLSNNAIIAAGEGSNRLSIYSLSTGKTISRGELDMNPSAVAVNLSGENVCIAAASRQGDIYMLNGES